MEDMFPRCDRKNSRYHFNNVFLDKALLCDRFYLYQMGERYCNDMEVIRPHKQFCAEITFVISGKGVISTNGTESKVGKGDCYFSFLDEIHSVCSDGDLALRYFFCGFNPADAKAEELINAIRAAMDRKGIRFVNIPELSTLFHSQLTEIQNQKAFSTETIGLLLYRMLITVYRALEREESYVHEYHINDKSVLAYQMMSHLDENFSSIKRLKELESVFYFKFRYLEKCFLEVTGITLSQYFKEVRMQHAAQELQKGCSVTEISEKLNFSSIYSFSRAFSDFYGCSPSEYRKQAE